MRNFEERKAEVFRRSEKRIRERKRVRNRILMSCVPLCLILTIWSVTILPKISHVAYDSAGSVDVGTITNGADDADGVEVIDKVDDADGLSNINFEHDIVLVSVKGTGEQSQFHSTVTDISEINEIYEQISMILSPYETTRKPDSNLFDDVEDSSNGIKASSYIITMTTVDGAERIFKLTNDKLYDAKLDIVVELSDEHLTSIKSVLGLTD
jgi:hypothetical protein